MLEQLLRELKNYFVVKDGYHFGKFKIVSSQIQGVDFLANNQFFMVEGSVFNDGLYINASRQSQGLCRGLSDLVDEEFEGTIMALAIPQAVVELAKEISDWVEKYNEQVQSPYQSESFGGYSYSKKAGSGADGGNADVTWQSTFRKRMKVWKKI